MLSVFPTTVFFLYLALHDGSILLIHEGSDAAFEVVRTYAVSYVVSLQNIVRLFVEPQSAVELVLESFGYG